MTKTLWNSVLVVSLACVAWGFWLSSSPMNDWYRYGFIFSGTVCLIAFAFEFAGFKRIAAILLFLGSIAFLVFPSTPFAGLFITGNIDGLIFTIRASYNGPTRLGLTTIQALIWRVDLLLFSLSFTIYYYVIIIVLLLSPIVVRVKHAMSHRTA